MTTDPMDRRIREWARDYHRPPATPREEMWAGVREALEARAEGSPSGAEKDAAPVEAHGFERARTTRDVAGSRPSGGPPWLAWVSAAAAVLVMGIGIGRVTAPISGISDRTPRAGSESEPTVSAERPGRIGPNGSDDGAVHTAAVRHLDRTEALLSVIRADADEGRLDPTVARWGRGLLLETRLLMDAADESDPELQGLLEDLELILAQVVLLSGGDPEDEARGREELRLIADGVDERDLLTRIRAVLSESGLHIL